MKICGIITPNVSHLSYFVLYHVVVNKFSIRRTSSLTLRICDIMSTKVLILRVSNETLLYCINYYVYLEVSMETPLCAKNLHKFMIQ